MRIDISGLEKSYKEPGKKILNGVSLQVSEGEKTIILGLNGAGKTTLIKCLLGLLKPEKGEIKINGSTNLREQRINIGVVSQYNSFDRRLSISDNLEFHAGLYSVARNVARKTIESVCSDFGLSDYLNEKPNKLSGGTLRKAILARTFITSPNILILDEPTTNVDPHYRSVLHHHIDKICVSGGSVILSTHIRDDILESGAATTYILQGAILNRAGVDDVSDFFKIRRA
jgi:ABC-type multidrug transport system ATPase subunit